MKYLKKYEDVTINADWDTILGNLIMMKDIEAIKRDWIDIMFFDLNTLNKFGNSPLKMATTERNLEIMKLFLEHGANPNFPIGDRTPLMSLLATYNGNPELTIACIKMLISHGANVNARSKQTGRTAIIFAAEYCDSIAVMKELIKSGANLFVFDDLGRDVFYYADKRVNDKKLRSHRMLKWLQTNYFNDFAKHRLARANSKRFDL